MSGGNLRFSGTHTYQELLLLRAVGGEVNRVESHKVLWVVSSV
jgi:hypothetical protein